MTRTKIDMSPERQLITYMIVSTRFAREILPLINQKLLKTRYAQVVYQWVKDFFDRFEEAPGKAIQDIYLDRRASLRDEEEADSVAEFLQNLSNDADSKVLDNLDFHIDLAVKYLKTRSLEHLQDEVRGALSKNEPMIAEGLIAGYARIGRPSGDGYSLLGNSLDVIDAFMGEGEAVLSFPGAVGQVVGPCLRGDLVSFIAPVKRGKTWALLYASEIGQIQRRKVAFFTLEMPKAQIIRRGWQSMVGCPRTDSMVSIPYFAPEIESGETIKDDTMWRIEYKDEMREGVKTDDIAEMQKRMGRIYREGDCRFIPTPARATTVKDIETILDNMMYYDNYEADIVVIDYADLLGSTQKGDYRHQLDDIWSNLRRVAQERNILIVTATQTNRAGLSGDDITIENVAEDMRKLAHVSKLISLDQTVSERDSQIMRWHTLLDRGEVFTHDSAVTLTCLKIGKFVLDSRLSESVKK